MLEAVGFTCSFERLGLRVLTNGGWPRHYRASLKGVARARALL